MKRDYLAHSICQLQEAFSLLERGETARAKAKNVQDKDERRRQEQQAQQQINEQHQALAAETPAAAFYYLVATNPAYKDRLRSYWQEQLLRSDEAPTKLVEKWKLTSLTNALARPQISLAEFFPLSFHLSFRFALAKAYLSRDDDDFYILDNPVKKDKVFKLPYVSPGSWKGALRNAGRYIIGNPPRPEAENDNSEIQRLFGTDKRLETEHLHAGRLRFFPTFFSKIKLEVINPHLRATGAGDMPIFFEVGSGYGYFSLLYFPFGLAPSAYDEAADDLENAIKAIEAMFTVYGFGAKTSDGFGIAADSIEDGVLRVRFDHTPVSQPSKSKQSLASYLESPERLKPEYLRPDGQFVERPDDYFTGKSKKVRQEYDKAMRWWEKRQAEMPARKHEPTTQSAPIISREFTSFAGLNEKAAEIVSVIRANGGSAR